MRLKTCLILACMCLNTFFLTAQNSVKTDSLTTYAINLSLSGRYISGTFSQTALAGRIETDLENRKWHINNQLSYRYNNTNTRKIEDNWYDLLFLSYYIHQKPKIYVGAFYHYDNNIIFRVNRRHRYGAGIGGIWDKWKNTYLQIDIAGGYENTFFNGNEFANSDFDIAKRNNGLLLFRLINKYTLLDKKLSFSYRIFYMQSTREAADYDIWITPQLSFRLIKNLSLNLSYDYRFENVHLQELSNYNDILLFGLSYKIKQKYRHL